MTVRGGGSVFQPLEGAVEIRNEAYEKALFQASCKAAVKGNYSMTKEEVMKLLEELMTLNNPYNCPHGRPTIISMSKYEIEKKFKRIV